MSMLTEDPESTILKRLKRPKPEDTETPDNAAEQHGELGITPGPGAESGYDRSTRVGMQQLLGAKGTTR
jgi:hypothetical protein